MADRALRHATPDDLLAAADAGRSCEIVSGELVEKAMGDEAHGTAQVAIAGTLFGPFNRRGGGGGPGGWWLKSEVDIAFDRHDVLKPDIAGWRRDRLPVFPSGWPTTVIPDWVCEILSTSTARRDLGPKREVYHRARVGHYWVVDRAHQVLQVLRWAEGGYQVAMVATPEQTVRAEPFDAIPLFVGLLSGADPEEG
jgi:Uma2 family endonuclease